MRCAGILSLVLVLALPSAASFSADNAAIDFPCFKNLVDGRVLVDGVDWDRKMRQLGYVLDDGAYVPYEVLSFTRQKMRDDIWADGTCRMKLLPVAK